MTKINFELVQISTILLVSERCSSFGKVRHTLITILMALMSFQMNLLNNDFLSHGTNGQIAL